MKRLFLALAICIFVLTACGSEQPPAGPTAAVLPVLKVDGDHMTTAGLSYEVPAGEGFVLDATGFDFGATGPMAVQVMMAGKAYQMSWAEGATTQAVRARDLQPLFKSKPIYLFPSGQQLIISVGSLNLEGRFTPLWVATVDIK